ncbi:putative Cilia- and flagella-associated protein 52 [Paratrimastix pyriformis]|uniref:Cilia- and flagella-associated protein 52 n=1 Tax=Paratrimastix pyriformis TaxID=342808 RepID=A0ABQ8UDE3_9EUKA|nr:putative Cilia- and flagella-associated protein 52 [Paratrimastix pyriformis]
MATAYSVRGEQLVLDSVIGFGGTVPKGLQYHPNERNILFPLGSTVVIRDTLSREQFFLQGHTGRVSCLAISSSGRYIATGEETHMGFQAAAIIWDFETRQPLHKLVLHKGKVQALAFSPSEQMLASIGGIDDNAAVVWDVQTGRAICGASATNEAVHCVAFFHNTDNFFVTAGQAHLRVWEIDTQNRKIRPNDCQLGHYRRVIQSMVLDMNDEYLYCGTTTGDVLAVSVRTKLFKQLGPAKEKDRFELGVTAIDLLGNGEDLVVGSGSGRVALMHIGDMAGPDALRILDDGHGAVTSLHVRLSPLPDPTLAPPPPPPPCPAPVPELATTFHRVPPPCPWQPSSGPPSRASPSPCTPHTRALVAPRPLLQECLCGTAQSNMYTVTVPTMAVELRATCHAAPSHADYSELFATSSAGDIRLWNARTCTELLRIQVPNVTCNSICFNPTGTAIISGWSDGKIHAITSSSPLIHVIPWAALGWAGWSDGKIRGFGPESGRLLYVINDAHKNVTALAAYRGSQAARIVSGGSEGQVRVWQLGAETQTLLSSMKEHRGTVNCIRINNENSECISAASDGSCVVWDLTRYRRKQTLLASTNFKGVSYTPDNAQILTCGTDRKVVYWDDFDGSTIRELEGSPNELAALDIDRTSYAFATAGADKIVRLWHYDDKRVLATGEGHSGAVTWLAFAPDNRRIVSVGDEGAILIWRHMQAGHPAGSRIGRPGRPASKPASRPASKAASLAASRPASKPAAKAAAKAAAPRRWESRTRPTHPPSTQPALAAPPWAGRGHPI